MAHKHASQHEPNINERKNTDADLYHYDITEQKRMIEELATRSRELERSNEELATRTHELQGSVEELTTRSRELEGMRSRLRAIIDASQEAMLFLTPDGYPIEVNTCFTDFFGLDASTVTPGSTDPLAS